MKYQNARRVRRGLWLCALAAGAACSGGSESAPSRVPAEPTAASAPAVTTTTAEWRTLPYPLVDENEDEYAEVRIKFIAYGDVDPNDDIAFGMIPDLQIAVITERELQEWWDAIVASDLGYISYPPPGAQIQSAGEDIASLPIDSIITGSEGTAETYLKPSEVFLVCVISPVDLLIAGCGDRESTGRWREMVFYIYFSHGRAYINRDPDGSERYHRLLYRDQDSYSPTSEPATLTFISTTYVDELSIYDSVGNHLEPDVSVAIIKDPDIGVWWESVLDFNKATIIDDGVYPLNVDNSSEFGWKIPYNYKAQDAIPESTISTDSGGMIDINLTPGDYIFCHLTRYIIGCNYEYIAATQPYVFKVDYGVWKLSDSEGKQLLEDTKNWPVLPQFVN